MIIDTYELEEFQEMVPTALMLMRYRSIFKNAKVFFAMGSDLLKSIKTWELYEESLKYENFILFKRTNHPIEDDYISRNNIQYRIKEDYSISSTIVRTILNDGNLNLTQKN